MTNVVDLESRRVAKSRARAMAECGHTVEQAEPMECVACGSTDFKVWADNVVSCANPKCRTKIRNVRIEIDESGVPESAA